MGLVLRAVQLANADSAFSVSGREILLDGEPFEVQGMCYQPTPIGMTGAEPPYGDYYTSGYSNLWARDFTNLRLMGANVIRIYGWTPGADHSDFLDTAYNDGDQSLYLFVNKWINPGTDWNSSSAVNSLISEWESIATELKDHPAVMGFLIGNEVNAHNGNGYNADFWEAMNQIAGAVKVVAPSKLVSVAITDALDQVQRYDAAMSHLDFWAVQVYRGHTFGPFFTDYTNRSARPLIITEFGYDAYDAVSNAEFTNDAALPADAMEFLWNELRDNRDVVSGACIFEYADEWWKAGSPSTHDAPAGWPAPFVDGEGNEEWWGVFRTLENGVDPDLLERRAMFYRLAAMWNEPFSPDSLRLDMSPGNPEVRFRYPAHLRDQMVQVEVSADLNEWTTVADNTRSVFLESFASNIVLTSTEINEEVQVSFTVDTAASGMAVSANRLANGDFEFRSTLGWSTFESVSSVVAKDGMYSLELASFGGFDLPSAVQTVPASPGDEFNLSGYLYTPATLPANSTFGLFKIVFADEFGNQLLPASVSTGHLESNPDYPGAESRPLLNSASPAGSWEFSEVQAVAPDNTASVSFFVITVDESSNTMYADSIEAVEISDIPQLGDTGFFRVINSGR